MKPETFTSYHALDFAQEPSFIRWVRAGDADAAAFWENWLIQHPEKAAEVQEARRLAGALTVQEEEPESQVLQQLWERIDAATATTARPDTPVAEPRTATKIRPIRRWLSYAAAACITLLMVVALYNPSRSVSAGIGEQLTHQLPDGSTVAINAASKITYHPLRWFLTRSIQLEGEAFFEVTKGRRFVVETAQGEVEVLGTSFNVKVRGNSFAVSCVTGKVRVSNARGEQILTPGLHTQADASGALTAPYSIEDQPFGAWRDERFYFNNAPMQEVFEEIQRQFDVRIQTTPENARRVVTMYFEGNNLDTALANVEWFLDVQTIKRGNVILVK